MPIKTGWAEAMDQVVIDLFKLGAPINPIKVNFSNLEIDAQWELDELRWDREDAEEVAKLEAETKRIIMLEDLEESGYEVDYDWTMEEIEKHLRENDLKRSDEFSEDDVWCISDLEDSFGIHIE